MLIDPPDLRPLHRVAVLNSLSVVDSVRTTDLDAPTPCAGWRLRDLLAHMTVQHHGFAAAARGFGDQPDVWRTDSVVDAINADPTGTYAAAVSDVMTAFADDAVVQASFALPEFGANATFPGAMAIGFHFIDYVVHGWDVAESLGVPYVLPDDVVDTALPLSLLVPDGADRDSPGAPFAHAIDASSTTNFDRMLRHLGRDPEWAKTPQL